MNKDDLLRMLDLGGQEAAPEGAAPLAVTPAEAAPGPGASPTAVELDAWALRKGAELLAESERLRALGVGEHAAADFFAAAFLPDPALLPECEEPLRREFLDQLLGTPQYRALHAATRLRELPSAIAAASFAEQFARLKQEQERRPSGGELGREVAALRAAGRALGLGPGEPGSNDPAAIAALYRRVRNDPALRRICTLAGRFRRVAQSRQRQKASHGLDDVVGVTLSGDPSKLLPMELAKLAVPELELDALRRLAERRCLAREHRAAERVGKGPIIVVVGAPCEV